METYIPRIVCFTCDFSWGFLSGHDTLNQTIKNWIPVTCSSRIDSAHIFGAFAKGADGILILGCPEGNCHYEDGNFRLEKRMHLLQSVLDEYKIERERVKMIFARDPEGSGISQLINQMTDVLTQLGPLSRV